MAIKRNERYPGRFSNPTSDHPQGAFKNRSAPTAQDGSYLEKDWANDWDGFFARLMTVAGVTANGNVDTATSSQYYDALVTAVKSFLGTAAQRNVGGGLGTNNIPDMSFFTTNAVGGLSFKFPNGMLIQTGTALSSTSGPVTINLQTTYPNSYVIVVSSQEVGTTTSAAAAIIDNSKFNLVFRSAGALAASNVAYITLGY